MISYASVGSNRLPEAMAFYDALLGAVGMRTLTDHRSGGRIYGTAWGEPMFGVLGPFDGAPATVGNGSMSGFALDSREQVDLFHAKALELGGANEGDPGVRGPEERGFYFAYVRDLDGNKLCAFHLRTAA